MKPYKLAVSYEAVQFMQALSRAGRQMLHQRFKHLQQYPHLCCEAAVHTRLERDYFVYAQGRFAIKFWIDEPECEVKVIDIWLR